MQKIPKREYTAEFKEQAVKRVKEGRSVAAVAKEMGLVEQTLRHWVKGAETGSLSGAGSPKVTPEQMELSRLRAENARLKRENDIPAKSDGVLCEGGAVKDAWIDARRSQFTLGELCAVLDVSVSGYRAWKGGGTPDRQGLTDTQLLALLQALHAEVKGAYGRPRMVRERRARGFSVSQERGERLRRENGLQARHQRRYKATTDSTPSRPVADNVLARDFTPSGPNQVWTSDITYRWTEEGWLSLAIVLDLFNREVVGWSLKPRMTADLVTDALTMAWLHRQPAPGLLHHSDRGSQYASHAFQDKLQEYGMVGSMSRQGNCWDNAPTESWFNSFKQERVFGERFQTREAMKATAFEYIEVFYNRRRLHSTLGYTSPVHYLKNWREAQQAENQVA
ncbi:IS3 family transposase [Thiocystis violacea]|uniref:IS3 family transposase n=1 Tax=Thiocystis violacea TaxID=13725 RepID=UPI001906DDA0|nr:IS3 family transposase [Thiocystis violacea]MBK1720550.1 IS3 family transposase [Thiocystis violacea]